MDSNEQRESIRIGRYGKSQMLNRVLGCDHTWDMLLAMDKRPQSYSELRKIMKRGTLSNRLRDLERFGIIKKYPITSERRDTHQWGLTKFGTEIVGFFGGFERRLEIPSIQTRVNDFPESEEV